MKDKILGLIIGVLALLLIAHTVTMRILAAAAPGASGELIIWVNPSTNLNANYLRITGGKLTLDDKFTNCVQVINWEAWRSNGVKSITSRGQLNVTMADMKLLYNAANPRTAIKNAVLADAILSEKP